MGDSTNNCASPYIFFVYSVDYFIWFQTLTPFYISFFYSYYIHTSILLFKANKFSVVFYNDEYDIKHSYNNQSKPYVVA